MKTSLLGGAKGIRSASSLSEAEATCYHAGVGQAFPEGLADPPVRIPI